MENKIPEQHAILQAAEDALAETTPLESNAGQQQVVVMPSFPSDYGDANQYPDTYTPPPPPAAMNQKFGDLPTQLREQPEVNFYDVKKLNLAAMLEALERANSSYETFPTPDAGFAVAGLSEQVQKLTKDLEKSQDPKRLYDAIMTTVIEPFTEQVVHSLALEMRWLKQETKTMVLSEKQTAHQETINIAVQRMGPSLKDSMELAKVRLLKSLNIKEKPPV